MSATFIFQTFFELCLVLFVVWGFFNEDKLVRLEKNIIANIRRRKLKVKHCNANFTDKKIDKSEISCYNTVC